MGRVIKMTPEEIHAFSKTVSWHLDYCKVLHDYLSPENRTEKKMLAIYKASMLATESPFDIIYDLKLNKKC